MPRDDFKNWTWIKKWFVKKSNLYSQNYQEERIFGKVLFSDDKSSSVIFAGGAGSGRGDRGGRGQRPWRPWRLRRERRKRPAQVKKLNREPEAFVPFFTKYRNLDMSIILWFVTFVGERSSRRGGRQRSGRTGRDGPCGRMPTQR